MGFAQLLLAMVQPLVARVLLSLGFSVVSFVGMDLLVDTLLERTRDAWLGLPHGVIQLAALAGIDTGLAMVTGAILTRVMIWQLSRSSRILGANP